MEYIHVNNKPHVQLMQEDDFKGQHEFNGENNSRCIQLKKVLHVQYMNQLITIQLNEIFEMIN